MTDQFQAPVLRPAGQPGVVQCQKYCRFLCSLIVSYCAMLTVLHTGQASAADCPAPTNKVAELIGSWRASCTHPLCGTVIDTGRQNAADGKKDPAPDACVNTLVESLSTALAAARKNGKIVLLGEIHDNPAHHLLRAELLGLEQTLTKAKPANRTFVFEQIRSEQNAALQTFNKLDVPERTAAKLFDLLQWSKSGWPKQEIYEPLIQGALQTGTKIVHGDPSRKLMRQVSRKGVSSLPQKERAQLHLDEPLSPNLKEALLDELLASHCGLMPKSMMKNLAAAQRYRDAYMARQAVRASTTSQSVTILAGNGHVRADRAVPWYIAKANASGGKAKKPSQTLTMLLIEVQDGKTDPAAYIEKSPTNEPVADFIILTPRQSRADPCIQMKKMMKKMKKPNHSKPGKSGDKPKTPPAKRPDIGQRHVQNQTSLPPIETLTNE